MLFRKQNTNTTPVCLSQEIERPPRCPWQGNEEAERVLFVLTARILAATRDSREWVIGLCQLPGLAPLVERGATAALPLPSPRVHGSGAPRGTLLPSPSILQRFPAPLEFPLSRALAVWQARVSRSLQPLAQSAWLARWCSPPHRWQALLQPMARRQARRPGADSAPGDGARFRCAGCVASVPGPRAGRSWGLALAAALTGESDLRHHPQCVQRLQTARSW